MHLSSSHRMTRRTALTLATVGASSLMVSPRGQAQTRQDRGKQLVDEALAALGGDAYLGVRNVTASGRAYSFYNSQIRGLARVTITDQFEEMQPNMDADWLPVSRREVYTDKGDYYSVFQNGKGWEVTYQGARPLGEEVLDRYRVGVRRDFFYFLRYRLNEPGLYYYHSGVEIIDNEPTNAVEITDAEGELVTVYFRQNDGLPHQQLYLRRDPKTRLPYEEKTIWSKYREVKGATIPWNVRRERDGKRIYEQYAGEVEVNRPIGGTLFRLPGGIDMLDPDA
jgi:hypothetical protein